MQRGGNIYWEMRPVSPWKKKTQKMCLKWELNEGLWSKPGTATKAGVWVCAYADLKEAHVLPRPLSWPGIPRKLTILAFFHPSPGWVFMICFLGHWKFTINTRYWAAVVYEYLLTTLSSCPRLQMMWKLHIPILGHSSYSGFWPHVICYSWFMHTFFLFIFCKHLCIIIHSSFQWFSLATDVAKLAPCIQERRVFSTTAKWDPDRFQSAASMSILVTLSYPWQETISFLNINQNWSQATDFTSRSKFGAVQIWPDILGLGPGLILLRRQFDISSSGKLPSLGTQLLPSAGSPPGSSPSLPKALPLVQGFQKPPACHYCS